MTDSSISWNHRAISDKIQWNAPGIAFMLNIDVALYIDIQVSPCSISISISKKMRLWNCKNMFVGQKNTSEMISSTEGHSKCVLKVKIHTTRYMRCLWTQTRRGIWFMFRKSSSRLKVLPQRTQIKIELKMCFFINVSTCRQTMTGRALVTSQLVMLPPLPLLLRPSLPAIRSFSILFYVSNNLVESVSSFFDLWILFCSPQGVGICLHRGLHQDAGSWLHRAFWSWRRVNIILT